MVELGATGNYPHGKLDETDEGELRIGITHDPVDGVVKIAFGKLISWLALEAIEAEALADLIKTHVQALKTRTK